MTVPGFVLGVLAAIAFVESPLNAVPLNAGGCSVSTTNVNGISRTITTCIDSDGQSEFSGQVLQQSTFNDLTCVVRAVNGVIVKECKRGSEPFHTMTAEEEQIVEREQKAMEERNRQINHQVMQTQQEMNMRMRDMRVMQQKIQQDINSSMRNMQRQMTNMQSSINDQIRASMKNIFMG